MQAGLHRDRHGQGGQVIFNRLERGMPLKMDSTVNYALNRTTLKTTTSDTRIDSPYNSYQRMGLPPTPIDNPGEDAMRAAINPPPGDWLYFVTVKPGDTRFAATYEEHQRNVAEVQRGPEERQFTRGDRAGRRRATPAFRPAAVRCPQGCAEAYADGLRHGRGGARRRLASSCAELLDVVHGRAAASWTGARRRAVADEREARIGDGMRPVATARPPPPEQLRPRPAPRPTAVLMQPHVPRGWRL
ncbi:endolytic transglycosylase MltG [Streptomyces sp. L7]